MKTTIIQKQYALLGLGLALALNMSYLWSVNSGSSESASSYYSIKECLAEYKNDPKLPTNLNKECTEDLDDGSKVVVTITSGKGDLFVDAEGNIVTPDERRVDLTLADAIKQRVEKELGNTTTSSKTDANGPRKLVGLDDIVTIEAKIVDVDEAVISTVDISEITEAAIGTCAECEKAKTLSGAQKQMKDTRDIYNAALKLRDAAVSAKDRFVKSEDKRLTKEQEDKEEADQLKKDKMLCNVDRNGRDWKSTEDEAKCLRTKSSSLRGKNLKLFLDKRMYPLALQDIVNNRGRNLPAILGLIRGGKFLVAGDRAATLHNVQDFAKDYDYLQRAKATGSDLQIDIAKNYIRGKLEYSGSGSQIELARAVLLDGVSPVSAIDLTENTYGLSSAGSSGLLRSADGSRSISELRIFGSTDADRAVGRLGRSRLLRN